MGKYLNPKDKPKEVWLFDNGFMIPNPTSITRPNETKFEKYATDIINNLVESAIEIDKIDDATLSTMSSLEKDKKFFDKYVIVDMVNNGKFRAAAVYENRMECLRVYNNLDRQLEGDHRQRLWFIVERDLALTEVRDFPFN